MIKYVIKHCEGQYEVEILPIDEGFKLSILDSTASKNEVIIVEYVEEMYDRCREWASTNIVGEFNINEILIAAKEPSGRVADSKKQTEITETRIDERLSSSQ